MESPNIWFALALSTLAGLSTGVGSALGVMGRPTNKRLLTLAMGFSAGVMVYVSFVELLPTATQTLREANPGGSGTWLVILAFFGGMALIGVIDRCVPSPENPHEFPEGPDDAARHRSPHHRSNPVVTSTERRLMRLGVMTTAVLAIHNFPEGIATLLAGLKSAEIGIPIALAVAIHNIPEGIAVAVPIHHATGSRRKAFLYSLFSGLAEPLGAVFGYLLLLPVLTDTVFGLLFAGVAGIMVFISFDQLLPAAERYGEHHASIYGVVAGMLVMAISLALL